MGKNAKKKGGKKKGGTQRKKRSNVPEMTWKEALLAYNINLKEKSLEDARYEMKQLDDQNLRFKARNKRLKEEQEVAIGVLRKASKDFEKMINDKDVITKESVVVQMMENWEVKKFNDQQLIDLEGGIIRKDEEIEMMRNDLSYWQQFREKGQYDNDKTIQLLEQEMVDMDIFFSEISAHLQSKLVVAREEIEKTTADILDKQKYMATEKAIAKMDKHSRREVIDNDWLTRETKVHRKEVAELFRKVEKLEEENLKIMSELFDCQVEDLHISRGFFMTQFAENENLGEDGILEVDLGDITHVDTELISSADEGDVQQKSTRPKSAIHQAVEDRIAMAEEECLSRQTQRSDEFITQQPLQQEEALAIEYKDANGLEGSEDGDPFLEFHHFDDDDFEDFLKLGPLELKLLSISGRPKPIYKPATPPDEIMKAKNMRPDPDKWPVTHAMLRDTLQQQSPRDIATDETVVISKPIRTSDQNVD